MSTLLASEAHAEVIELKLASHCSMLEYFFLYIRVYQRNERSLSKAKKVGWEECGKAYAFYYLQEDLFEAFATICKLLVEVFDDVLDLRWVDVPEIVTCIDLFHFRT